MEFFIQFSTCALVIILILSQTFASSLISQSVLRKIAYFFVVCFIMIEFFFSHFFLSNQIIETITLERKVSKIKHQD
jgi:hypothetical protein